MPANKPQKSEKADPMMSTMVVGPGWRPEGYDYKTLDEFFPYYMREHSNRTCRRLHFVGTTIGMLLFLSAVLSVVWAALTKQPLGPAFGQALVLVLAAHVVGYAAAWTGHFFFEHNKPATFKYPLLSYRGDYRMWWRILTGKIAF